MVNQPQDHTAARQSLSSIRAWPLARHGRACPGHPRLRGLGDEHRLWRRHPAHNSSNNPRPPTLCDTHRIFSREGSCRDRTVTGRGAAPASPVASDRRWTGRRPARLARRHYDRPWQDHPKPGGQAHAPHEGQAPGARTASLAGRASSARWSASAGSLKERRGGRRADAPFGLPDERLPGARHPS